MFTSNAHQIPPSNRGITTSRASISLENLDMTRPLGVVSKNSIGNLRTFSNNMKCKILAARNAPKCGTSAVPYDNKAGNLLKNLLGNVKKEFLNGEKGSG